MLLCQQFGGRHDRNLVSVTYRCERRGSRNNGLAAANITLNQSHHRVMIGQVAVNVLKRLALASGQFEAEPFQQPLPQLGMQWQWY
jgi:hypothetical protein